MHHPRLPHLIAGASLVLAGCPTRPDYIQCNDDSNCGLSSGGRCLENAASGRSFCAYPDPACPGGMRWSDYDVEGSISGACVMTDVDAGVDSPDAPTDGPPQDGPSNCALKVAFHDGPDNAREVWIANPDGSGLINVSNSPADDANPTWSADGTRIAFQSKRTGRWDLYIVNVDGSGLFNVTNTPAIDETAPVWSPDGQRIAFTGLGFNVMYANGTGVAPVTTMATSGAYTWSADSTRIVFPQVNPNVPDLFVATIGTGAQPINVTNSTAAETPAAWTPGPRLAYSTGDLFTSNPDGTARVNLTPGTPAMEYEPRWTTDGQTLVFTSNAETDFEIHRIAAAGGQPTRILDNTLGTAVGAGDWVRDVSKDGQRVLFERRTSFTASRIGVVAIDGTGATFFNGGTGTNARGATLARCP